MFIFQKNNKKIPSIFDYNLFYRAILMILEE